MLNLLLQARKRPVRSFTSTLLHLGAAGLFFLAILDSTPLPTFSGPDIVTAILAASHRSSWYEYPAAATAGSVIGAYLTFRVARKAGSAYLDKKFNKAKHGKFLKLFKNWATGTLIATTAVPLPTPTGMFFAAAGAGDYPLGRFLAIVTVCRGVRFFGIAYIAGHYGRRFLRVLRHPLEHWGWLTLVIVLTLLLVVAGIMGSRRIDALEGD